MRLIKEIEELKKLVEDSYMDICKCDYDAVKKKLPQLLPEVTEVISELIEIVIKLREYGVDIPVDILTLQLQNLLQGYENYDYVEVADTLKYEISDSLNLYIEIIEELKNSDIIL